MPSFSGSGLGSWNAPEPSVALASSTWNGPSDSRMLVLPTSGTNMREPLLPVRSAVLPLGTPIRFSVKWLPEGAPLPVNAAAASAVSWSMNSGGRSPSISPMGSQAAPARARARAVSFRKLECVRIMRTSCPEVRIQRFLDTDKYVNLHYISVV